MQKDMKSYFQYTGSITQKLQAVTFVAALSFWL